jgi:thioesterase domain-containing protein
MFAHPSSASIAAEIEDVESRSLKDEAICTRAGTAPPLFFAHAPLGHFDVSALAKHINDNIPVYIPPGEPTDRPPRRTVEGLAMRMVEMIRAVQPDGPYRIAGYSSGGILAYEIAVQLIASDQEVAFIGLIDASYRPGLTGLKKAKWIETNEKDYLLSLISDANDPAHQGAIDEIKSCAASTDYPVLLKRCQEMSLLPRRYDSMPAAQLMNALSHKQVYECSLTQYSAQQISIPIHLFVTCENPEHCDRHLGWAALLPESLLRVIPMPGSHESIMTGQDIQVLGRALSREIQSATRESRGLPERDYSPLTPLQLGQRGAASLFCLPGAGDSITSFIDLASRLNESWSIYGFQPRGIDGSLLPHSSVERAADCYVKALHETRSTKPVHLLGHSFGGWVAFEMALQLLNMGIRLASLTILDSAPPDDHLREHNMTDVLIEWIEACELILERSLRIGRNHLAPLKEGEQRALLHAAVVREGLLPAVSHPDILRGLLNTFGTSLRTSYRPRTGYPGPVRLILVDDVRLDGAGNRRRQEETVQGWRAWCPSLSLATAPGNHLTVLKPPHVNFLASVLNFSQEAEGVQPRQVSGVDGFAAH